MWAAGQEARAAASPQAHVPRCGFSLAHGLWYEGLENALKWMVVPSTLYHSATKGLQATSVLSSATRGRARTVL